MRRAGVDYGPFTIDEVLAQIDAREVDLDTEVCDIRTHLWENAATHELFRDYYEKCAARWELEAAEAAAEAHRRQMERVRQVKTSAWRLTVTIVLLVAGIGGWLTWRVMHAEPTGILAIAAVAQPPPLPVWQPSTEAPPPPLLVAA